MTTSRPRNRSARAAARPATRRVDRPTPRASASPDILAHLPIDRASRAPLHQQIYDGLRRAVLGGLLRAGQRLPSTRTLSAELGVSRLPVLTAYDQLLHEGYLVGRAGSGTFVSAGLPEEAMRSVKLSSVAGGTRSPAQRQPDSRSDTRPGTLSPSGSAARTPTRVADRDERLLPFRVSLPGLDVFPHRTWARLVARHAHAMKPAQMAYGNPAGVPALRAAIAAYLRTARAVRCEADQVLIVSGSQAALRICASVLLERSDSIAIEDPGYLGARVALSANGAALAPVPVDSEGIDVGALAALRPRTRAVYVTPSHQYPLGSLMSAARRFALLDWANQRDAWIIEDDYDSEYRYVSRPLGALQGMDGSGRTVYVGTFSKVLFPALRVGYLVVPTALRQRFLEAREALDLFSPTLYQLALVDFLREGHFARHLRRMRLCYAGRRDALVAGIGRHCAEVLAIHNADAGLHVATLLPAGVDDITVVQRMADQGLAGTALSTCYVGDHKRSGLLLGFGGSSERRIGEATKVLGAVLRHRTL